MDKTEGQTTSSGIYYLHFQDPETIVSAYMPYLRNGGIFIPGKMDFQLGSQIFLMLRFMDEPGQIALTATVVWINAAQGKQEREQGIGVRFDDRESKARGKLENYLPAGNNVVKTFTM